MAAASPFWAPHVHEDRRPRLLARNAVLRAVREHFDTQGFVEVDTATLQVSPGNEAHLAAFATDLVRPGGGTHPLYLHTSPEFAMKKLLAAGEPRLFTLAKVFRNAERSALHHPEFTMLEWYRAGQPYDDLMHDCTALLATAAAVTGQPLWRFRGRSADATLPPERLSVADAFTRHAGIDLLATLDGPHGDRAALAAAAGRAGIRVAGDDDWSDIFARILAERVEPHLGLGRSTILDRYPSVEAALARPCADDARVAERFELYVCGVELANGFGELTDAAEQRRRFTAEMDLREARYGERYPFDEDFLTALAAMPAASGIALGFDRLAMLAVGAARVDQVMWVPVVDPEAFP
ncbi:EF-P lysine aminoacylase EpmA [Lichenihabitans sp. Uapishka_5]|uniref:EF-P lysine aminoacylase EpmA n=1 Tax=Lichenihabitans sp. Uapishka_5 TaxID=3037302 RepID=UPI0029E7FE01|nr:EF-P lysine aminoacylase EpmA [Lichenihabitans sp. Uapishka_5]MDX7951611.1 EF-P lysine aminoacylase EpmA [Lichenihabitans sp. Uapishka_5]